MTDPGSDPQPARVAVRGVTKSFGSRRVLNGLDLEVPAGTITAVLGPSGCGKTTLLRIVAGFEHPDAGSVVVGDLTVAGGTVIPVHRRRVGLMPQEGALFPHLSVSENIAFGLPRAARTDTRRVGHWLDVVGLDGVADARPHELSGGQQQRVALARALAARPRVILLDEPFAALDAGLRVRVREDIAAILRNTDTTAMLVTHDQTEALSLADSVALLMDGRIVQAGPPPDIYERPATLATARFIGATVELAGDCRDGVARTALGSHQVRLPVPDGDVVVVLRPEQLHLGAGSDGTMAQVTANRFYGADSSVHVLLGDGSPLMIRHPGDVGVDTGQTVTVRVEGTVLAYPSPTVGQRVALSEASD